MLVEKSWSNKIAIALLYLLIAAIFVSYIPVIYLTGLYSVFSLGIMGLMVLLVVFTFFRSYFLKNRFLVAMIAIIACLVVEFVVFTVGHLRYDMDDVRQVVIVFLCMIVGYTISMDEQQLSRMSLFYIIGSVLLGLYAIVFYTGSFSFEGDRTLITGKNQIGGMVAVGGAIATYFYLTSENRKGLYLALALLAFFVSAILRDRSAFVAFLFFAIVLSFKQFPFYKVFLVLIAMLLFYLFFKSTIDNFFINSLIGRGDIDIEDLSTGRSARNAMGIQYLSSHFWVGELEESAHIPWIHNYLLLRLVRYGVWSMFFILIYLLFVVKIFKEYFRYKELQFDKMGFFIPIIPFFISLLEPSFPFGPGTVQVFVYVLFGHALQQDHYQLQEDQEDQLEENEDTSDFE